MTMSPAISQASSRVPTDGATLEAPHGIRIETAGVWLPAADEIVWQMTPQRAGEYELRLRVGQGSYTKTLRASEAIARRSAVRVEQGFFNQLMYPSEAPLPIDGPVSAITITYPEREIVVLGRRAHWIVLYVLLSMGFVFAMRRRFGVTI